jgi:cytochrome c nitrite reductase small subunit
MIKIPTKWKFVYSILMGILIGLVGYSFLASNAISYLSDSPKTCINCHVMNSYYSSWAHSSHRRFTTCNECHVPQNNVISKYLFKAEDGLRHATIFTMRAEPQVIHIKEAGKKAVEGNCLRCHEKQVNNTSLMTAYNPKCEDFTERYCWNCHREHPHKRTNSLSSSPNGILGD